MMTSSFLRLGHQEPSTLIPMSVNRQDGHGSVYAMSGMLSVNEWGPAVVMSNTA
jgi:hypothetical protein